MQVYVDAFVWPNTFQKRREIELLLYNLTSTLAAFAAIFRFFAVVGVRETQLLSSLDAAAPYCVRVCVYTLAINSRSLALNHNV